MNRTVKRKSTILAVLTVSIAVSIIISLFNSLLNFNFLKDVMEDDILEANRSTSEISFENINKEFESILNTKALIFFNSGKLENAIKDENANEIVQNIRTMSILHSTSPSIASYDIYYPKEQSILLNSNHMIYHLQKRDKYQYLPWLKAYEAQNEPILLLPRNSQNYPEHNARISYISRIPVISETAKTISAIHIDPTFFSNYINEQTGTLVILSDNGSVIYQTEGRNYSEIARTEIEKHREFEDVLSYSLNRDNTNLYVTIGHASSLPLYFVYISPSTMKTPLVSYLQSFFLNTVILCLANILILTLMTFRNDRFYGRRLKSLVPESDSGNRSFDSISEEFENRFKNLNSSYENAQPILIQNTLRLLLLGRSSNIDSSRIEEILPNEQIRVAIAKKARHADRDTLSSILAEELKKIPRDVLCYTTTINNETIIVINANDRAFGFTELQQEDRNLILYLSTIQKTGKEGLREAYLQALQVVPYGFLYPESSRLSPRSLNLQHRLSRISQIEDLNRFAEALQLHTSEEIAIDVLDTIIETLTTNPVTIEYCKDVTRDLVSIFLRNIQNRGIDPVGLLGYDLRAYYGKIRDIRAYSAWMKVCLVSYFDYIDELQQNRNKNSVKEHIDRILNEAPSNQLSLEYIATKMDMRTDELSRLFKSIYGINYSKYIRDRKMEAAKELLEKGHMVKDISEELGYCAPQYFIKVFKQTTGVTPNQYSKLIKTKGDKNRYEYHS